MSRKSLITNYLRDSRGPRRRKSLIFSNLQTCQAKKDYRRKKKAAP